MSERPEGQWGFWRTIGFVGASGVVVGGCFALISEGPKAAKNFSFPNTGNTSDTSDYHPPPTYTPIPLLKEQEKNPDAQGCLTTMNAINQALTAQREGQTFDITWKNGGHGTVFVCKRGNDPSDLFLSQDQQCGSAFVPNANICSVK